MNDYFVNRGEQRTTLTVPIQQNGVKPNPLPTAAKGRFRHRVTGAVLERDMVIDSSPPDRINLVYDWLPGDWTGGVAPGCYQAWWILTIGAEPSVVPAQGWDLLWVGDAP